MARKGEKTAKSFRLDRQVIALLETHARDNHMSQTEVVELAIKNLCRQGAAPATQSDIEALRTLITAGQAATIAAIKEQPIQVAGALQQPEPEQPKRRGLLGWLMGD